MKEGKYCCPKIEWRFVKTFTEIKQGSDTTSTTLKQQSKDISIPLKMFLVTSVMAIVSSLFYLVPDFPYKSIVNKVIMLFVFIFFVGTLVALKLLGKQRRNLIDGFENKELHLEDVTLYELTSEGIYINYFNSRSMSEMFFLRWIDIKEVEKIT